MCKPYPLGYSIKNCYRRNLSSVRLRYEDKLNTLELQTFLKNLADLRAIEVCKRTGAHQAADQDRQM